LIDLQEDRAASRLTTAIFLPFKSKDLSNDCRIGVALVPRVALLEAEMGVFEINVLFIILCVPSLFGSCF
jgi:hypothetical protein